MQYLWQHFETILETYDGQQPLHHFLKGYFARHKKLGSRDRRGLSDSVYAFCRCSKAINGGSHLTKETTLAALYLCNLRPKALAQLFPERWLQSPDVNERIQCLAEDGFAISLSGIFPHDIPFSEGIDVADWRRSILRQPRLFLRIRKDQRHVAAAIDRAGIEHEWLNSSCLALPNGTDVKGLIPEDCFVVQDASSQATGKYLAAVPGEYWWDCCAGAGGKSLMLSDVAPGVRLTATDIRPGILKNLEQRFRKYGIAAPECFVLDAADETVMQRLNNRSFDGIICDVPCTGSGTWARTPEGCYFFKPEMLGHYTSRQKSILRNAATHMKDGGRLIYITCSVFRAENEEVLLEAAPAAGLRVLRAELINGIQMGADSLFVAELIHENQPA